MTRPPVPGGADLRLINLECAIIRVTNRPGAWTNRIQVIGHVGIVVRQLKDPDSSRRTVDGHLIPVQIVPE